MINAKVPKLVVGLDKNSLISNCGKYYLVVMSNGGIIAHYSLLCYMPNVDGE